MSTAPLENIYSFQSNTGLVIPDTSNVRAQVIDGLKSIFGADFNTDAETPNGLLIDALTQLIKDFIGITAMNVNGLNITTAIGGWLEAIGRLFGVERAYDDTDFSYRMKILGACSRGSGFVQSIRNEILRVSGNNVHHLLVLNNGKGEKSILPDSETGIEVAPHSIYVSCLCQETEYAKVATAIHDTISAGCGFQEESSATKVTQEIDGNEIVFFVPTERKVKLSIKVNGSIYTGTDIASDTKQAVLEHFFGRTTACVITKQEISFAISSAGKNIIPLEISAKVKDGEDAEIDVDKITVMASMYISPTVDDISVEVVY